MYRIIHSFLLALAAVVAVSLLVAPQSAWTTTEATPPVFAAPSSVAPPVDADSAWSGSVCSREAAPPLPVADIDPDCIYGCERQRSECLRQARDRYESSDCYQEAEECLSRCFAGELDPDNPWNPLPVPGGGTECEAPDDPGCGNIRNAPGPSRDTEPLDGAESPRRRPHLS